MAVILQRLVGRRHGERLYPGMAGVAQSHNFYAVHGIRAEDGSASVVLGLGKAVVDGERSLWFSPRHPRILPQFPSPEDYLQHAQREFWSLDLAEPEAFARPDGGASLVKNTLDQAERDGTLAPVGSTYSADNDAVYDGISRKGVRLVTFAHVLKSEVFPLAAILNEVLELGSHGMAAPVELEFAANPESGKFDPAEFALLQIRPLVVGREEIQVEREQLDEERLLLYSDHVLGNGRLDQIRDVVLVRPDTFSREMTPQVALEVRKMNRRLADASRSYLLIGPGRWGTKDRWLGIPVAWTDISWARAIVETDMEVIKVKPSQGSHFFHNMTSYEVGYFSAHGGERGTYINWDWFMRQPPSFDMKFLRHLELDSPLEIILDGRHGRGAVLESE